MLYVLSKSELIRDNKFKIGIHGGSEDALRARYRTSYGCPIIKAIVIFENITDARKAEDVFKNEFTPYRQLNDMDRSSEIYHMPYRDIWDVLTKHETITKLATKYHVDPPIVDYCRIMSIADLHRLILLDVIKMLDSQRLPDNDRICEIRQFILHNYGKPSYTLGTLVMAHDHGIYHLIDGQHRLAALKGITQNDMDEHKIEDIHVQVQIHDNLNKGEMRKLFQNINSNVSVPAYNYDKNNDLAREVEHWLHKTYGKTASASANARVPNISVPNLVDGLHKEGILQHEYEKTGSAESTFARISRANTRVGRLTYNHIQPYVRYTREVFNRHVRTIEKKSGKTTQKCFLGLIPIAIMVAFIARDDI